MSVAASPSSSPNIETARRLNDVRARGGVTISFKAADDGKTRLADLHERGGFRAKMPRTHGLAEAVIVNTGGGLLGGDMVVLDAAVAAGAAAQVTTQSAERIYRSLGPDCAIDVRLDVGPRGRLHWLPQETILFSGARLARTINASVAPDAALLLVESTVFGRAAMNETVNAGAMRDVWRISRGERLVYADTFKIADDIATQLGEAAVGGGASAMATIVYVAPDAADHVDGTRAALERTPARAAVSSWNGMLIARLLAPSADALKDGAVRIVEALAGHPVPRVWGTM